MVDKKETHSGWPGDCSDEQLKTLGDFREAVTALGCENPPYDDAYLLRFLRARKFDLQKTLLMWNNFIQWRKENNVDTIDTFVFHELEEVKKFYPHGYFRTDRKGRPVYIERLGKLKLTELFKVTTQDRLIRHYTQSYERLLKQIFPGCSVACGSPISQGVTILDCKGGSLSMVSGKVYDFIKLASKLGQDYYPEILGDMFIINTPMLFTGVWAMIKGWLDEKTRNKIKVLGSKYEKELHACVDPENLPDFLGGKCTVDQYGENLDIEQGPWVVAGKGHGKEEEEEDDDKKEDFYDLKNALSGLKGLGGTTTGGESKDAAKGALPSDTPLNTQMDDHDP